MALPINIESLLSGSAVESNQLEYKEGWNPDTIYRSICAFANDFEDTGGGYIIVGVKEEHGHAVRPVLGVNPESIEQIEKDMVGYNNLIRPYYQPRLFIEEVDGKTILIIKVTAGERLHIRYQTELQPNKRISTIISAIIVVALCRKMNMNVS